MGMEFAVYSGIVTLIRALMLKTTAEGLTQLAIGGEVIALSLAALFAAYGFLDPSSASPWASSCRPAKRMSQSAGGSVDAVGGVWALALV